MRVDVRSLASDREVAIDLFCLLACQWRLTTIPGLVRQSRCDLIHFPPAHGRQVPAGDLGRNHGQGVTGRDLVDQGRDAAAARGPHPAEAVQQVAEGMGTPEVMLQAAAPAVRHLGIGQKPGEEAEIAEGHAVAGEARGLQRADGELQHPRLGGDGRRGAEPLKPGLGEFLRAQPFVGEAEGRAEIAVARLGRGVRGMAEMEAAGRHGEIGPEAHFRAGGIGEDEGAGADVFARALEEDVGRLDDVGRDLVEAGAFEHRHDGRVLPLQRLALRPGLAGHGPKPCLPSPGGAGRR